MKIVRNNYTVLETKESDALAIVKKIVRELERNMKKGKSIRFDRNEEYTYSFSELEKVIQLFDHLENQDDIEYLSQNQEEAGE